MTVYLDWWQLGWAFSGFLLVMFIAYVILSGKQVKKAQEYGEQKGWHDRQHWEGDELLKGALQHAFDKKQ